MSAITLRLISTIALAGTLTVNALANILPINGLDTGAVSQLYPSLFTPAGITFTIWTLIYALLVGFVVYGWMRRNDSRIDGLQRWFILTCVLNASWILAWHYLMPGLSVLIMLLLLSSLLIIFLRIHAGKFSSGKEMVWVSLPFTLYVGWICVATIANVSALLVSLDWSGGYLSPQGWTVLMMSTAAILAFVVTKQFGAPAFTLVVMWALLGIYMRWQKSEYSGITIAAIVLEILLAIVLIYFSRKKVSH
jgi:translocator protein